MSGGIGDKKSVSAAQNAGSSVINVLNPDNWKPGTSPKSPGDLWSGSDDNRSPSGPGGGGSASSSEKVVTHNITDVRTDNITHDDEGMQANLLGVNRDKAAMIDEAWNSALEQYGAILDQNRQIAKARELENKRVANDTWYKNQMYLQNINNALMNSIGNGGMGSSLGSLSWLAANRDDHDIQDVLNSWRSNANDILRDQAVADYNSFNDLRQQAQSLREASHQTYQDLYNGYLDTLGAANRVDNHVDETNTQKTETSSKTSGTHTDINGEIWNTTTGNNRTETWNTTNRHPLLDPDGNMDITRIRELLRFATNFDVPEPPELKQIGYWRPTRGKAVQNMRRYG